MTPKNAHAAAVDAWIARAGGEGLPAERLLEGFEHAFGALSRRAQVTLSDVTLSPVVDRVLHQARERHPVLAGIETEGAHVRCDVLRGRTSEIGRDQLLAGIRFALVELLVVIGNLTAEILTPALHAELAKEPAQERERSHSKEPGP
jgi:hypothetical protein